MKLDARGEQPSKKSNDTAIDLADGGKLEIFSLDCCFLARRGKKVVNKKSASK